MTEQALRVLAGPTALARIRAEGLPQSSVQIVPGASGGPKFFVLNGLDRALWGEYFRGRREPLYLIGSSSGSWRFAAACQDDPVAAMERFQQSYRRQSFAADASPAQVSASALATMDELLGEHGIDEILAQGSRRLAVVVNRLTRTPGDSDVRRHTGRLARAAMANFVSRRGLARHVERVVFHVGDPGPLREIDEVPTRFVPLTRQNLRPALLASGSIPRIMSPVRDIPGAGPGVYYDGGVTDYHFGQPFPRAEGLVLQPHFYPTLARGWFDKHTPWRRVGGAELPNTVLLVPGGDFIRRLPGGRIPDRRDFLRLPDDERMQHWQQALEASEALGETFLEWVESGRIRELAEPMP